VDFDADLGHYKIQKGVFHDDATREVYAPVAMWLEAVDMVLNRLKSQDVPFARIMGISGACQQHGSVYWARAGEEVLAKLDPKKGLVDQLKEGAFTHPFSPNWQDASTQTECDAFDVELGSPEHLATVTGSKAHHVSSFSFPKIAKKSFR
jgi:xylulokinase